MDKTCNSRVIINKSLTFTKKSFIFIQVIIEQHTAVILHHSLINNHQYYPSAMPVPISSGRHRIIPSHFFFLNVNQLDPTTPGTDLHKVAPDECCAARPARLAVDVHVVSGGAVLPDEVDAEPQLLLTRRHEDVGGAQLQKVNSVCGPVLPDRSGSVNDNTGRVGKTITDDNRPRHVDGAVSKVIVIYNTMFMVLCYCIVMKKNSHWNRAKR